MEDSDELEMKSRMVEAAMWSFYRAWPWFQDMCRDHGHEMKPGSGMAPEPFEAFIRSYLQAMKPED